MKKIFCCFKGESSNQTAQQPSDSINNENDELDEERPFGNNEFLNNAWRNCIELPDDRNPPDTSPNNSDPSPPPHLPHSGFQFRWHEILDGTQSLQHTNFLGQGNFGDVYRCDFPVINKVGAAKVQNLRNAFAHREFMAEITTLHAANHPNVIKLLGRCFDSQQRVIVYEFMPKGSLDHHLYASITPGPGLPQHSPVLEWYTRMRIAVGVAEGLVYLHEGLKMIHRDVKVANVLLDEDFVPKLTDFGLATKVAENEDGSEKESIISPIKGTPGYIAPETEADGFVSTKSDVYSYGVFLLALFTGRKAYDIQRPLERRKITDWLMPVWSREENLPLVVDVTLGKRFSFEGLVRLFQAARMCVNPQVLARPDMNFVESMVREAAAFEVPQLPPVTASPSI